MRDAHLFHITSTSDDGLVNGAPGVVERVVVGTEAAGETLKLHDCATEGAAAPGNLKTALKLDARGSFELGARFATGIVTVLSGGAPDLAVVWS